MKRFSRYEKKSANLSYQKKPDRAETFQEVWIFLLQHARKVTGFVAIF
ncbi:PTS system fructose-specific IIBC component [Salmonella enterica]|nr:PTS system fructose-specific IIBC component [Salmonella enterica]